MQPGRQDNNAMLVKHPRKIIELLKDNYENSPLHFGHRLIMDLHPGFPSRIAPLKLLIWEDDSWDLPRIWF